MPSNTDAEVDARLFAALTGLKEGRTLGDTWEHFLDHYFHGTPADAAAQLLYAWADRHSLEITRSMKPLIGSGGGKIEMLQIIQTRAPGVD